METGYLYSFILYFSILVMVGFISYFVQKIRSDVDFLVGNRSLNYWVTAISAHASDMSSWLFMGIPAIVYAGNCIEIWIVVGLVVGMFFNWHLVAPQLRKMSEKYQCFTVSTFFEKRFDDKSGAIGLFSALIALFFFTFYLGSQLMAMGLIFESLFGINYGFGIGIGIAIVGLYTILGGFVTVAWTDFFQGIFLMGMIILVSVLAFMKIDGIGAIKEAAVSQGISLSIMPSYSLATFIAIIFAILKWGLGYFGQLHILARFMGIKNVNEMHKSKYIGISWQIICLSASICVGIVGISYFHGSPVDSQLVFVEMAKSLFSPFFAGFILCAILAATISTMDSQIIVVSSVLTEDIYKKLLRRLASPKELLYASRTMVVLACLLSFVVAIQQSQTIYEMIYFSWSGLGSAFGPLLLLSFYSKKINRNGALAAIITGAVTSGCWSYTGFAMPSIIPGFLASTAMAYIVSNKKS